MKRKREHTVANAREGVGMAENRPEVETIEGPKQRKEGETELVEFAGIAECVFLRETKRTINSWPNRN